MTKRPNDIGVEGDWICVGAFGAPHGVRGDVRLKSFTDDPQAVFTYGHLHQGPDGPVVAVKKKRPTKDGFVVQVDGYGSPEQVAELRNKKLYVAREVFEQLADDEFYLADLINLKVEDIEGQALGTVHSVENYGADDLIEVKLKSPQKGFGRFVLIPFTRELVPDVDIAGGYIRVDFSRWQDTQGFKEPEPAQGDKA